MLFPDSKTIQVLLAVSCAESERLIVLILCELRKIRDQRGVISALFSNDDYNGFSKLFCLVVCCNLRTNNARTVEFCEKNPFQTQLLQKWKLAKLTGRKLKIGGKSCAPASTICVTGVGTMVVEKLKFIYSLGTS